MMKGIIKYTLLMGVLLLGANAYSQEQASYRRIADRYFIQYQFSKAAAAYEKMAENKKVKPAVLYRLAYCYEAMQQYEKALKWYKAYCAKDAEHADRVILLKIGELHKTLEQYDNAKSVFQEYLTGPGDAKLGKAKMAGCDSALLWLELPLKDTVKNEEALNTADADWGVAVYDGGKISFTSEYTRKKILDKDSKVNAAAYGWTNRPYMKLYQANGGQENPAISDLGDVFNKNVYHVGPATFSRHFDTAYFTVTNPGGDKALDYDIEKIDGLVRTIGTRKLELYYSITCSTCPPYP